ncbi:MAG TPA: SGNH/GDSL hydrolase family protein [Gemmataceae bacterium]|jgi:lysophospholipase L1-like esterase|nr:SGNH/GDSL hydrolase family protein [Gemmataceae bacterium]
MRFVAFWLALILVSPLVAQDKQFFFQKGDRVVFLGDSITEQYQYSTDIELYLTTRFPGWNLVFLNAGIGGDTANGGAGRFQSHVLDEKPTAVTINFGMNDAGYGKFDAGRNKQYVEKTTAMLDMAKKAGVRVALISPNAVDRRGRENFKLYVETQKEFYAPLKELAATHGATFVDQYATTRAALEKMEQDKADKVVPFGDGFHTASPGGLLMAHAILTGLGAPAKVSDVSIDAGAKSAAPDHCKVENLMVAADHVRFDRTDEAVPIPVQKDWVTLLPYVNELKDLNYYGLTVKGLAKGIWGISIGGVEVAKASADDLEKGINLGNVTRGPIWEQGKKAFDAINAKNQIVHGRFRGVLMVQVPDWLADVAKERKPLELSKRLEQVAAKQAEIYKMVQPATQKFDLKLINQ